MRQRLVVPVALALVLVGCAAGTVGRMSPEAVEQFVAGHWRLPLAPQGAAPASFSALEASLAPEACGSCHPAQLADWRTSLHAASLGPGVAGQLVEMLDADRSTALSCYSCHAPLAEQRPLEMAAGETARNPVFDPALHRRGLVCAGCHVRQHERFGPPRRDGSVAGGAARDTAPHGGVTRTAAFQRSEFCRECHQFRPDGLVLNGKPVQNTFAEWQASRFARQGVQCQSCHMPDRRHLWRGIHDPAMVKSGVTVSLVREAADGVAATLRVTNSGVGHAFPTYVTPLVVLRAELVDAAGTVMPGSREEHVIGRQVELDLSAELTDTRLMPGEHAELRYRRGITPGARARFSVIVYPDAFYTAFFETLLAQGAGRGQEQIEEALAATRRSWFPVFVQELPAG